MGRLLPTVFVLMGLLAGPASPAAADDGAPERLIVGFRADAEPAERSAVRRAAGVRAVRALPVGREGGVQVVRGAAGARRRLEARPEVAWVEPDERLRPAVLPDDPLFGVQWALRNTGQSGGLPESDISASRAWTVTTGSADVVVAVLDTGVARTHPDLAPNTWVNPGESGEGRETNGIDDDANGYIDDVHGWDFYDRDNDPDDPDGHGTHVAGSIAARGNDAFGMAGVVWESPVMGLRFLGPDGGWTSDAVAGFVYAARAGARIVNASFGGGGPSQAFRNALDAHPETILVAAAGNEGANVDTTPYYPCAYERPNVICVAATDRRDVLASWSNRGATRVHLAAPGVSIRSAVPGGGHQSWSGTSMAAPHVSGALALMLAHRPDAETAELRTALLDGVEPVPGLTGLVSTGGRLDAAGAIEALPDPEPAPWPEPSELAPDPDPDPVAQAPAPAPVSGGAPPASSPAPTPSDPPAPSPDPGGAPEADEAPRAEPEREARTSVRVSRRIAVRTAARRGISARCLGHPGARCTVRVTIPAAQARRIGLRSRRAVRLGTARATIGRRGYRTLRVRPTRRVRAALLRSSRRARGVRLLVEARASGGSARAASRLR